MSENSSVVPQVSLESLRLRPGTILKIRTSVDGSAGNEVKLLAAVKGQNVMVTLENESGIKTDLKAGFDYVVSGFSGQHDFSFSAQVTHFFQVPFPYAILTYPNQVRARLVRKIARAKTSIPAVVSPLDKDIRLNVMLSDLSGAGALIESPAPVGDLGEAIMLTFDTEFENNKIKLALPAKIIHINISNIDGFSFGVEFGDISQDDKLVLHYIAQTNAANGVNAVVS